MISQQLSSLACFRLWVTIMAMIDSTSPATDPFWQELAHTSELSGHALVVLKETVSTNTYALELGRGGASEGTVVIARSQTGGRGRLGKSWLSPPDSGLYFSVIMSPALAAPDLPETTLAAGVALCRAVSRVCGVAPMIKWPNDLLLAGKKCGGILTEAEFSKTGSPLVVLGIGLNVSTPAHAFPAELRDKATSLHQHGRTAVCRLTLLKNILADLDALMARLEAGGFAEILDEWRGFDATMGKRLTWVSTALQAVTGTSLGPDNDGRLRLRDDQGRIHEILSGDIRLQSP